jgi:hypothetical protein
MLVACVPRIYGNQRSAREPGVSARNRQSAKAENPLNVSKALSFAAASVSSAAVNWRFKNTGTQSRKMST